MRIAIIGFQKSGKTTVFNSLTGQKAETSAFVTGQAASNQAIVKVPDPRLDQLSAIFKPKKHTPATVDYIDLAGIARAEGESAGQGLGEKQMNEISTTDALLAVVRGFPDIAGAAPDVEGDIEAMNMEMVLSDLKKIESRLERIEKQIARSTGKERDALVIELEAINLLKPALEEGQPARAAKLSEDQLKSLRGFQFLTLKPTMYLINDDEAQWTAHKNEPVTLPSLLRAAPLTAATRLCGQMEMEIAQLPEEERTEFLESYQISEPAAHRVIRLSYELLGRISFFTVGPDECRAWTIQRDALAPQAAGAIHSDLERGFIRAEVIQWKELLELGSYAEAKKKGKLRVEGKAYIVRDGDVVNILFSV
jgi:GTP-binding protein YchF